MDVSARCIGYLHHRRLDAGWKGIAMWYFLHFLGQNFAKAFNVQFVDKNNKLDYVWAYFGSIYPPDGCIDNDSL